MSKTFQAEIKEEWLKELNDLFHPTEANYDFAANNQRKRELSEWIAASARSQWADKYGKDEEGDKNAN